MSSFSCTRTPKSFSTGLLSRRSFPNLYKYLGLSRPKCSTLHLALLNLVRFSWAHFSSLSRSLWMASLLSNVLTALLSLVSSANLLRVHLMPSSISLMKSTDTKTNPCGTPLVTSLYPDTDPLITTLWLRPDSQFLIY